MKSSINLIISGTIFSSFAINANADTPVRPNVIFIMTDQQTAEAMSCRMGKQFIHTPAMDNLADNGMLFTRAYTPNPLSGPARNSLYTGRYPHETGTTWNDPQVEEGNRPHPYNSMGNYFKDAGYETAYFGKWHLVWNKRDIDIHGFDIHEGPSDRTSPDIRAADAAIEFLSREHDKPFLMAVNFLNPHNICEWARRAAGREQVLNCGEIGDPPPSDQLPPPPAYPAPQINEPDGITFMRKMMQVDHGAFPVSNFTAEDWRIQRWGYYRMVELVDKEIGRIMEALRKKGLEDNTLIVFTSDHGELAGTQSFNQKTVFLEESVRVPLIITWKGKTKPGTNDKLVNIGIDILPTILECADIELPRELPGRSLWQLALGKKVRRWRDYLVVQNDMRAWFVEGIPRMEGRMLLTNRYKYCIYNKGNLRESLVDLKKDPGETIDLANDKSYRKVILKHRELLTDYSMKQNDSLVSELLANDLEPKPLPKTIDSGNYPEMNNPVFLKLSENSYSIAGSYLD